MFPWPLSLPSVLLLFVLYACATDLNPRQSCAPSYNFCSPKGSSVRDVPVLGPGLARLYVSLLQTVDTSPSRPRTKENRGGGAVAHERRDATGTLCCAQNTQCLLVLSYNLPVCWDRFTTNYYLPDGSYGSITSGNYTTPAGDHANLITGNYQLVSGQTGNIYQQDPGEEPNTSTLLMPTQFTSSGVGSAIPASQVGGPATYTSLPLPLLPPTPTASPAVSSTNTYSIGGSMTNGIGSTFHGSGIGSITASATSGPEITPPTTSNGAGPVRHGKCHQFLIGITILAAGVQYFTYR
ncbi:hypothetical protein A1O3_06813 [Capronia epimyces CBS 606.96]|uniref:Uncharacterized protein n=1 Tax=Capronia epimyces CBS 606.96 TaxID=1182542 RepID=W9Y185_9EURO|nr:uncharacterized protein A1O3_06813 [Capronia epimyces CBS 606.96]EXJ82996.1 hypothetical protein A1O3_06813 [Capronia epimyces CBS 606.96]